MPTIDNCFLTDRIEELKSDVEKMEEANMEFISSNDQEVKMMVEASEDYLPRVREFILATENFRSRMENITGTIL